MAWYDNEDTGAFDMGGFGDVDFSETGAFDLGGFDIGNLDLSGAFDLEGLNLGDIGVGAFDLGGLGSLDLGDAFNIPEDVLSGDYFKDALASQMWNDLGMVGNAYDIPEDIISGDAYKDALASQMWQDLGMAGTQYQIPEDILSGDAYKDALAAQMYKDIDAAKAVEIPEDVLSGDAYKDVLNKQMWDSLGGASQDVKADIAETSPYEGLGYSEKDIQQLQEGTYAGQEQTEEQVKQQLGEDLYKELYPEGVDKLSSGSYTGLGYTAKEIADLMAGAAGVRETDWSGQIKGSDVGGGTGGKKGEDGKKGTDGKTGDDKKTDDTKNIIDTIKGIFGGQNNAALMALLGGLLGLLGKDSGKKGPVGYQGGIPKYTATRGQAMAPTAGGRRAGGAGIPSLTGGVSYTRAAQGGLMGLAEGGSAKPARYLRGGTDGMADKIQTNIDGKQPARLSHGEFVIPADVVSHLGNGNSDAGADVLYDMMEKVRKARTGNPKQGKQINPRKYTPA